MRTLIAPSISALVFIMVSLSIGNPLQASSNDEEFIADRNLNPCNPLSAFFCGFPYPSSYYQYTDASSATGKRIYVSDGFVSEVSLYDEFSEHIRPSRVLKGLTGFSVATSILFKVPNNFDREIRIGYGVTDVFVSLSSARVLLVDNLEVKQ